jgi:hypothetical protein
VVFFYYGRIGRLRYLAGSLITCISNDIFGECSEYRSPSFPAFFFRSSLGVAGPSQSNAFMTSMPRVGGHLRFPLSAMLSASVGHDPHNPLEVVAALVALVLIALLMLRWGRQGPAI